MSIITNYENLKQLTLSAIIEYAERYNTPEDCLSGLYGKSGRNRAANAKLYLESTSNPADILAILLAIFGEKNAGFFGYVPGRSSVLARLIAGKFITGEEWVAINGSHGDTLASTVFSTRALDEVTVFGDNNTCPNEAGMHFDKTKGVRDLLQRVMNNIGSHQRQAIQQSVRVLKKELIKEQEGLTLSILPSQTLGSINQSVNTRSRIPIAAPRA